MIDLLALMHDIHAQNVAVGWWDEPRPYTVFNSLFISELSEGVEGDRKKLMDDKLPHYWNTHVEIADFVIRVLDFLGGRNELGSPAEWTLDYKKVNNPIDFTGYCHFTSEMTVLLSLAYSAHKGGNHRLRNAYLAETVIHSERYAVANNFKLWQIVEEKREFNKHRADHKRDNRKMEGGKSY